MKYIYFTGIFKQYKLKQIKEVFALYKCQALLCLMPKFLN